MPESNHPISFAELDAQIHHYESAALALKRQRNERAPLLQLPQEILLEIFLVFRELDHDRMRPKDLIRLTQVCALWRDVAVNAPSLWTRTPTHRCGPKWTSLTIERAKPVPLDVLLITPSATIYTPNVVLSSIPRMSKLVLKCTDEELESFKPYFPASAPLLEELEMYCLLPEHTTEEEDDSILWRRMPEEAFRDCPKLRRLTFDAVDPCFDALQHPNLVSLTARSLSRGCSPREWDPLVDALRRMPLLEEVSLDSLIFPMFGDERPRVPPVELTHLRNITISIWSDAMLLVFLSFIINTPRARSLSLKWDSDSVEFTHQNYHREKDFSKLHPIFESIAARIHAANHGHEYTTLEVSYADWAKTRYAAKSEHGFSVDVTCRPLAGVNFVRTLQLTNITHLSINEERYNSETLHPLLIELPHLQSASVGSLAVEAFFGSLALSPICVRQLKFVTWRDTSFDDPWQERRILETVSDSLRWRQNLRVAIREFTFQNVELLTPDLLDKFEIEHFFDVIRQ